MSEEYTFPRFYFSQAEPNGRQFNSQEELDAAGGPSVWLLTPQAVEEAAKVPPTPAPTPPPPTPDDEGETPTRRSHR
jgi:hypothetical protein